MLLRLLKVSREIRKSGGKYFCKEVWELFWVIIMRIEKFIYLENKQINILLMKENSTERLIDHCFKV